MPKFLQNKTLLIIGGNRGIGLSVALHCAQLGAKLIIAARSETELQKSAQEIFLNSGIQVEQCRCDISSEDSVKNLFAFVKDRISSLYGMILTAGVHGELGAFVENSFADWESVININLIGVARAIHQFFPLLKAQNNSRIILFSGGGQGAMHGFSAYVSSKGGIWRLTETLGLELSAHNIFLNAIAPGAVNTRLLDDVLQAGPLKVGQKYYDKVLEQQKTGGESALKAAQLCEYLLSDKAHGLYGKILSAVWDDYNNFVNLPEMSKTDIFCVRRIVDAAGNTRN